MKIALLGYGKEGQAAKKYFENKYPDAIFDIFKDETPEQIQQRDYSSCDIILRSPSIPPFQPKTSTPKNADSQAPDKSPEFTSLTRYFFDHCPCPIIGVTATKGKGTTCSFIKSLLDAEHATNPKNPQPYLVGNIGTPAIEVLDRLTPDDIVVYEMSSFQLWDLEKPPHIAVIGQLEPDHLNVHSNMADYLGAKSHITKYQTKQDYLIYFQNNPETVKIASNSPAQKVPYPFEIPDDIKQAVKLPGRHNLDNAIAAIAAVAVSRNISPDEYLTTSANIIKQGLSDFKGLPHRLEFVRELNGVKYYDDNFSTNPSSLKVAVDAFPDKRLVVIAGGRDKTNNQDLPEIYDILQAKNISKIILIGESGHALAEKYPSDPRFQIAESLEEAVRAAKKSAEASASANSAKTEVAGTVVLMSPAAASFDMFKNVYDRGDQFKSLICSLAPKSMLSPRSTRPQTPECHSPQTPAPAQSS